MTTNKLQILQEMEALNELRKLIDKDPEAAKSMLIDIIERAQLMLNTYDEKK